MVVAASGDVDVVGVRFHPGRAYPFLAVAPWEIVDHVAPALDVVARELVRCRRGSSQGTTEISSRVVERALLARLARVGSDTRFDRLASALVAIDGPAVTRLADAAGISLRQFERLFNSRAGVSAKVLQRVVRFHRWLAPARGARAEAPDLATLALDGGFFDQAHMSHEFRALADVSPSRYPREAGVLDRLFAESRPVVERAWRRQAKRSRSSSRWRWAERRAKRSRSSLSVLSNEAGESRPGLAAAGRETAGQMPFCSATPASEASRGWWSRRESNPRPPRCERGALPSELLPHPWGRAL